MAISRIRVLLPVAGLVLLAACSSGTKEDPHTWAMTGLDIPEGQSLQPILTAKVDNTAGGRPQKGVNDADLVVQEFVEGGATRVAAFFESNSPQVVGPIRSIRTSDVGVVQPVEAVLVASGGAPEALEVMKKAGVKTHLEGSAGFKRDPNRPAPYNLYVNLEKVRESIGDGAPPKSYLEFGKYDAPSGDSISTLGITFSPETTEQWAYDSKSDAWVRGDRGDGGTFSAKNLLMIQVEHHDAGYKDPAGNYVPAIVTTGSGAGWLAVGQQIQPIKWSKESETAIWELTTESGSQIELPPGKSWISLLPKKTGKVDHS